MATISKTISLLFCTYLLTLATSEKVFTDEFAVHIRGGRSVADDLAAKYGYVNKGQIGELQDHYSFHHQKVHKRSVSQSQGDHMFLEEEPQVEWLEQQHIKKRVKRDFQHHKRSSNRIERLQQGIQSRNSKKLSSVIVDPRKLNDPEYRGQWYMSRSSGPTMNVEQAWEEGYTGTGVVVSILDDGIELNHPDLKLNYDQNASYDYNGHKADPSPRYEYTNINRHGTRCAGEVAMQADNKVCGVGIAYNARIGGIRMLDGDVTDMVEGESLSHASDYIDIYSASWGPDDDGRTVDGPGKLAKKAFADGISRGRSGLGSIYVWASGNGGHLGDSCSCDGYTNSIYTASISSASENGASPWYLEKCSSTLATTYSSGDRKERKVVTTDLHSKCTAEHTGTSASAPLAAGIIALALQANPTLTWRDVQYLIVRTSNSNPGNLHTKDWVTNGVGYNVSHSFGFGLMDAEAMVEQAKSWTTLPEQRLCQVSGIENPTPIDGSNILRLTINTTACYGSDNQITHLEHVQTKIKLAYSRRGALEIRLTSPSNTQSKLLLPRRSDSHNGPGGFASWPFLSTHFWGEEASGVWTLEIENTDGRTTNTGDISEWELLLYGTSTAPEFPHKKTKSIRAAENDQEDEDSWDTSDWDWDSYSSDYSDAQCHEECWDTGCKGPNAEDCYKCKHFRDRETKKCVQYCPDGQYPPTYLHEKCKHCNRECKTCVGPNYYDCTSCSGGLVLLDGECLEECDDGYYEAKDKVCYRCNDLCELCTEDPDNCQACVAGAVLDDNNCKMSCPNGFYLQDEQCKGCDETCDNCHGPEATDCISCNPDLVHKGNMCVDQCEEGFYISTSVHGGEVSRDCIACHDSCKTCDGFVYDDCLTCDKGFYLNYGQCEQDCRDGTFKSVDDGECHDCTVVGCRLCITEHICIACDEDRVLTEGRCDEGCQSGSYEVEGECFPCHELCKDCDGDGLTDCTSCKQDGEEPRYLMEGACLPFCPVGFYMDDDSFTCKECDETCHKCTPTECLECVDERVDPIPNSFYCGENEDPSDCARHCATCMTDDGTQCLSCDKDYYMFNYECIDECPKNYFKDVYRGNCRLCHPTCKKCNGFHVHDCLSCDPEYVLTPVGHGQHQTCETQCPQGTYEATPVGATERKCSECNVLCETCDGPEEDECITCTGGRFLQVNWELNADRPERKCVDSCEEGTFGAPDDHECLPCHPSCKTCENTPNHCLECSDGYVLQGRSCINDNGCRDDQYTDPDGICKNCDYTCQSCNGGGKEDCLTCDYYRFLTDENTCNEVCPENFYPDFDLNTCEPCHETCKGCVMGGASDCLNCREGLYSYPYDGQACLKSCPVGFYKLDEGGYKTCQQCSPECEDCHGSYWQCVSCNDDTYLYQNRCLSACPYKFREDDESNHCIQDPDAGFPCPLNCETCDDWGDCQECETNYTPYYGECIPDTDIPCPENKYPVINETNDINCYPCSEQCLACQGPGDSECLDCPANKHLDNGRCLLNCPDDTYLGKGGEDCMPCHPLCETCDGPAPNECLSCDDEKMMKYDEEHRTCHPTCPDHTYFADGGCSHCHPTCGTCNGATKNECLTCKDGLYHFVDVVNNSICNVTCMEGYFGYRPSDESTDNYECHQCHSSCKTCFGETASDCTSCPSNMYKQGLMCVTNCEEGLYPDSNNICQQCNKHCETCHGPSDTQCLTCNRDRYMQEGSCKDACDQGWFPELAGHRCSECHQRCLTCNGEGLADCLTCRENYIKMNGTCYSRCEVGKYWKNGTQTCEACDPVCSECFGPNIDHCISCNTNAGLVLKRLDVNHSSCVTCCEDEALTDLCCYCNEKHDKCLRSGEGKGKPNKNSGPSKQHLSTATVVLGVILAIAFCLTVFCLLQARSKKMWCFKASYDRLPAYYDSKGNHVIMSKQYQHEKINVMSDDEDFYEDIDSEEEED